MLTESTPFAATELTIEHVPAVVRCAACDRDTVLDWPVLACAHCGRHDVELRSGDELQLAWLDVGAEVP
jgi:hydrogenase nickel incorporation protein HypA/HybF